MATVARRLSLKRGVGETLLTSKLQILVGTGSRRPSTALSILTGRVADQLSIARVTRPHFMPRTVYLTEKHLRDIDAVVDMLSSQHIESKRLTRSAVLRRAVEHLRNAIEADPAKFVLENE
jgi:hypothetical protein